MPVLVFAPASFDAVHDGLLPVGALTGDGDRVVVESGNYQH